MEYNNFDEELNALHNRVPAKALTEEEQNNYTDALFESIKHINEYGLEFWYARELSKRLEYKDFRNFELAIFKAMDACKNSGYEISDHFGETTEMVTIAIRREMAEHNKLLVEYAKNAGVETSQEYAIFQNYGYKGLYGGMSAKDIHSHKKLKPNEKILDHMGYEELAANLFRATQTEAK